MKVLIGAVSATLLMIASAAAQTTTTTAPAAPATPTPPAVTATSSCAAVPAQPPIPDGATSTGAQFQAAVVTFNAWVDAVNGNLTCRGGEVHAKEAELNSLTQQYNAQRQAALAATQAMTEQQGIYNQHHPSSNRQRSHNSGGAR